MAGFMELQVDWFSADEINEINANCCEPNDLPELVTSGAWGARYSAPGYMDCTDYCWASTPAEALKEAFDLYSDGSPEERSELASLLWECRRMGVKRHA